MGENENAGGSGEYVPVLHDPLLVLAREAEGRLRTTLAAWLPVHDDEGRYALEAMLKALVDALGFPRMLNQAMTEGGRVLVIGLREQYEKEKERPPSGDERTDFGHSVFVLGIETTLVSQEKIVAGWDHLDQATSPNDVLFRLIDILGPDAAGPVVRATLDNDGEFDIEEGPVRDGMIEADRRLREMRGKQ